MNRIRKEEYKEEADDSSLRFTKKFIFNENLIQRALSKNIEFLQIIRETATDLHPIHVKCNFKIRINGIQIKPQIRGIIENYPV